MHKSLHTLPRFIAAIRHRAVAARHAVRALRQRLPVPVKRWIRRTHRWTWYAAAAVVIAWCVVFILARLWLPTLAERRAEIESYLTDTVGNPVKFESLDTFWDGVNPGARVTGFRLYSAAAKEPVMSLREVRLTLAWWPLLTGHIAFGSLTLVEPSLVVERGPDGQLHVSGLSMPNVADPAQKDFGEWLLQQHELVIENGTFHWLDRFGGDAEQLTVTGIQLTLRNSGERHRLDLRAGFPGQLCGDCRASADITGFPLRDTQWHGEISVQARELSVQALPRILHSRLPAGLDGRFQLRVQSLWREGRPVEANGQVAVSGLSLPLSGESSPVPVRALDTVFSWKGDGASGQVDFTRLQLGLTRPLWLAGRLQLDYSPERTHLAVDRVDVGDVSAFVAALPRTGLLFDWLREAQPQGRIERLDAESGGPPGAPKAFRLTGDVRGVHFKPAGRIPGIQGLAGSLTIKPDSGEFRLDSGAGQVQLPYVFKDAHGFRKVSSLIRWRQNPEEWLVQAGNIVLHGDDGLAQGDIELRFPKDPAASPAIKLRLNARDGAVENAARYFPLTLPEALRTYLARAVVAGRATDASAILEGELRNFPFRDGNGRFEVTAHVRDGVFDYLPGWTPVRDLEADLHFTGTGMLVTATRGRLNALDVGRLVVAIEDFKAPGGAVIAINGRAAGEMEKLLDVLTDSKSAYVAPYLPSGLHATGTGALTLELRIPARHPADAVIAGNYRFLGGSIEFPFRALRLESMLGEFEFGAGGIRRGQLHTRFLGGDSVIEAAPEAGASASTRIEAHGLVTQAGLEQAFGAGLAAAVRGEVPWTATLRARAGGHDVQFNSDLRNLELHLPAPLAKASGEPLSLAVRTASTAPGALVLDLQAEQRMSGKLAFGRDAAGWRFKEGHIGIGEKNTQLTRQDGLHLSARLPALNADAWWQLLRHSLGSGVTGWFDIVSRVSAEIGAVEVFGRPVGALRADIRRWPDSWHGTLEGAAIAGRMVVQPPASGRPDNPASRAAIHLALERLALPPARPGSADLALDPRSLPRFSIKSAAFAVSGRALGALDFSATPVPLGWRITNLKLGNDETMLTASGLWEVDWQGRQASRFNTTLTSRNLGRMFDLFGYPDELAGGRLELKANAVWPGAPTAFGLARLNGEAAFTLSDGRLPKISPGAGRLLGVLDLRALTRYLTLDFSSLFGTGMAFDSIKAKLVIENGNAYTRDLAIHMPGADFAIAGRIGLSVRDVDLKMGVTPRLMEELAITGGLLGGPVVGAAIAVLHNLVRKPFEKSTRIDYTVKGGWDNPAVTRLGAPAPSPGEGQPNP